MNKLQRTIPIAPTSVTLETYLAGLENIDLNTVMVAGEDLANNVMMVSIHDLPGWIKAGARFELKMSKDDVRIMKRYFQSLDLRKKQL